MNILVISKLFDPNKNIGAVRTYNFANKLGRLGHQVYCVISDNELIDLSLLDENVKVITVTDGIIGTKRKQYIANSGNNTVSDNLQKKTTRKRTRIETGLRKFVAQLWNTQMESEWSNNAVVVCKLLLNLKDIDTIITSYGPISNLQVGLELKKRYPRIKWISDMRDPVDSIHQQWFFRLRGSRLQKKMLRSADKITTVCDGIREKYICLMGENYRNKIFVLPNGYCDSKIHVKPENDGILRIGYTGQLYNGMRDMTELFRCINAIECKTKKKQPIQILYAGDDANILYNQAESYNCQDYIVNYGKISKAEALNLQERCDLLCVLTWNTWREQGVLTGKFPEYLRLSKPIIAIITGELKNAELSRRIDEIHIGFSYESAGGKESFEKFVDWIERVIALKKDGKSIIEDFDDEIRQSYSYDKLVNRLEDIIRN